MGQNESFQVTIKTLKRILRSKKISYRDLAQRLGLTESGIKKIFTAKDCSFSRLNEICQIAGIKLADLLKEQDGNDLEDVSYTEEQQQYFLKHRDCLHFFWKLAFERLSVEEIQSQEKLSTSQTFLYLKKLDDLKLIHLDVGGKVRVPRVKRIRSFGKGPLIEKLYLEWSQQFMKEAASPNIQEGNLFILRYLRMKKETYAEFLSAIKELEKEFLKRAVREMTLYDSKLIHVRWISAIDQNSFVKGLKS